MAIKKKAAKPAAKKPAPKKVAAKPVKKAAPAKKPAKPAAKKPAPAKAKIAAKKPVPKHHTKPTSKPAAKKALAPAKTVNKILPKPTAKPVSSSATKKPVAVQKPVQTPMAKKTEEKKAPIKEAVKPPVSPKAIAKNPKDIKVAAPKPVVIPKITTKTSRKYSPDFTKSVLDQVKNDPGAPIVRYNDSDLLEFRELIQRKLEAAKKELNYLQGLITRKDEMGGDESENRYMTMEDGSLSMEREQLSQMASRQITFIDHLEKAMMRIENKTYGICRVTGKLIDKARLRAVPHATLSIEAKMGIVK
ncbi:MAG: TraR/DksA C4-type zinc finger protein [Ferruginibacter sp.]